ncbi:MAG: Ldh family oxidoreductase [Candidatus Thiodiazotropha sp.]
MNPSELLPQPLLEIERVCRQALSGFLSPESAVDETLKQLLDAELRGKRSHGLVRIPWLRTRLGRFQHTPPEVQVLSPWLTRFECRESLGYLAARQAADSLQQQLLQQAFSVVVCNAAFPTGVIGDYLRPLARSGHVALGFATSPPLVSFEAGEKPLLGTNPIAVAMPGIGDAAPFVADVSPAPATFGQLLALLFGAPGEVTSLSVETREGQPPQQVSELFDDEMRLTGKIIQRFDDVAGRRQYALTLAVEALTTLFAGHSKRGALVMIGINAEQLPGLHPGDVGQLLERLSKVLGAEQIPGAHGEARLQAMRRAGELSLPRRLWEELTRMASG